MLFLLEKKQTQKGFMLKNVLKNNLELLVFARIKIHLIEKEILNKQFFIGNTVKCVLYFFKIIIISLKRKKYCK